MNVQDPLALRRAALMRQQRLIQEQLDQLEAVPELEAYPDGTVIRCRVNSSGGIFTYVFFKIVNGPGSSPRAQWYNTGVNAASHRSWRTTEELTKWLTDAGRVILEWTLMLPAGSVDGGSTVIFQNEDDLQPGLYVLALRDGRYRLTNEVAT